MQEPNRETRVEDVETGRPQRPGEAPAIRGVPARRVWRPPFVGWRTPEDAYDHVRPTPMDEMP